MKSTPVTRVDRILVREAIRLFGPYSSLAFIGALCGVLSGLATAWLLIRINQGLQMERDLDQSTFVSFGILCVLGGGGTALAGSINSSVGQKVIAALRKDIAARILRAPLPAIEAAGHHRLLAALSNDVDTVSSFMFNCAAYAISIAIVLGSFGYLLFLSWPVFIVVAAAMMIGVAINVSSHRVWLKDLREAREGQDDLYKQYRAITEGAKELKINRQRRIRVFHLLLSSTVDRIAALKGRAMRLYWITDAAGSSLFFIVIGVLLAGKTWLGVGSTEITGAVLILLYVKSPVEQIAAALPILDQARVSFGRIVALSAEFGRQEANLAIVDSPESCSEFLSPLRSIELRDVNYTYPSKNGSPSFTVGPINLTIPNEHIVFIVGENGSGKTTLLKLMLGLYEPHSGSVLANDTPILPDSRDDYRQLFSCIFSDYYLFEDLVGEVLRPEDCALYLDRLGIHDVVSVQDGNFSTIDLSTGQRKRLALLHAYGDKRPVIVTDEWAADQDPGFRRVFYEELLPELKRSGKMVIVISHDDRYFSVADRIIRMKGGRIVEQQA